MRKEGTGLFSNADELEEMSESPMKAREALPEPPVRQSLIQAANTFGALIPPFVKFIDSLNGIQFKDELRKTERKPNYTSMLITFINFLTVADICRLRMLNTSTYFASTEGKRNRKE